MSNIGEQIVQHDLLFLMFLARTWLTYTTYKCVCLWIDTTSVAKVYLENNDVKVRKPKGVNSKLAHKYLEAKYYSLNAQVRSHD